MKGSERTEPFLWPWEPKPTTPPLPDLPNNTPGPITVTLESNDGKTVYATGTVNLEKKYLLEKYEVSLTTTAGIEPTKMPVLLFQQTV